MSLYNEVRPIYLNEVKGQGNVVTQIRSILASGKIPNVVLFVGHRGTGKTSVARIFSKSINCEHPSDNGPCNSCETCKQIDANSSFDIIELDAASHNKVEDVHALIDATQYAPTGKYKVYIIDEVHMLSTAAFNALLKLLEEPPAYCRFILCTTEEHKVPVTILSRCRKFYFEKIELSVVIEKMATICAMRGIAYDTDALRIIAKRSEGCMRDAESLLEIFLDAGTISMKDVSEVLGTADEESIFGILSSTVKGDATCAIRLLRECSCRGKNLHGILKSLIEALSDSIYYLQTSDFSMVDNSEAYKQQLSQFASCVTVEKCLELMQGLTSVIPVMQKSNDTEFILETQILSLIHTESELTLLKKRVAKLASDLVETESALYEALREVSTNSSCVDAEPRKTLHQMPIDTTSTTQENILGPLEIENSTCPDNLVNLPREKSEIPPVAEASPTPEFFSLPAFNGDLPGDISVPTGTQIMGTISLFGNSNSQVESSLDASFLDTPTNASINAQTENTDFVPVTNEDTPFVEPEPSETTNEASNDEADSNLDEAEHSNEETHSTDMYANSLFAGFADLGDLPIIQTLFKSAK